MARADEVLENPVSGRRLSLRETAENSGGEVRELEEGEVLGVPPGVPHEIWAGEPGARVDSYPERAG